jgi:hypothetical protein
MPDTVRGSALARAAVDLARRLDATGESNVFICRVVCAPRAHSSWKVFSTQFMLGVNRCVGRTSD